MIKKLIIFIFLNILLVSSNLLGKEKCDYTNHNKSYNCKYVTKAFPKIFYGNYHLKCGACNIHEFNNETFIHDNTLISVNLTNSGIRNISANSFHALTQIQFLDLTKNNIRNISTDAFKGLHQLYELFLDYNKLENITSGTFNDFEANFISITHNKLTEIPNNAFEGIRGAMTLDLSNNQLHTLYPDSFKHFKGLEYLNLGFNNLCNIQFGVFKHLSGLKHLSLAGNRFKKFGFGVFSGLPMLHTLNISHNSLAEFDGTPLLPLTGLMMVDISANGLNYLDGVGIRSNAPGLRRIALGDNLFVCNSLANLIRYFRTVFVEVLEHDKYDVPNIHGIACIESHITDEKIPFDTFYKISNQYGIKYNYC